MNSKDLITTSSYATHYIKDPALAGFLLSLNGLSDYKVGAAPWVHAKAAKRVEREFRNASAIDSFKTQILSVGSEVLKFFVDSAITDVSTLVAMINDNRVFTNDM